MIAPGRFVLLAVLLLGSLFAIVTPPFQVPDEPAHFYRAYRVSEGRLDLLPRADRKDAPLPVSVHRIGTDLLADLPFHPDRKIAPRAILAAFQIPLTPGRREPVFFHNTLQYTFLPYVPQAVGIAAGRLLGAPVLALFYLSRLVNLLCGALAIAFAVRRLPAFGWLAAMVALTPMSLSLLGSASADATTIASSFVLVSAAARLAWGTEGATRGDLLLLATASAVLCASKFPYLPLALLALLIPPARLAPGLRKVFLPLHLSFSLLMAWWEAAVSRTAGFGRLNYGVDPGRQIHDSLLHPLRFLRMTAAEYVRHAPDYLEQTLGRLGWLDTQLPQKLLAVYLLMLLALVLLDASPALEVRLWQRGVVAAAVLAALVLIGAAQYATWTPYGANYLEGIQGRYLLPLVFPAAWIFHGRRWAGRIEPRRLGTALAAFSLLSCGIVLWVLVRRYYGV